MGELGRSRRHARNGSGSDATTLDRLYRDHAGWLLGAIGRRFRGASLDVDDLVHEAFIRLSRYVSGARADHPRALLFNIAANLARDEIRREIRRPPNGDPALLPFADRPVDDDRLETLFLKQLIIAMPRRYRDVFVLSRFTGLSYEEIAQHLGLSVKTVEWRMRKALALCATVLGD